MHPLRLPIFHLISNTDANIISNIITNIISSIVTNPFADAPVKQFKQPLSRGSCDRRGEGGGRPPSGPIHLGSFRFPSQSPPLAARKETLLRPFWATRNVASHLG